MKSTYPRPIRSRRTLPQNHAIALFLSLAPFLAVSNALAQTEGSASAPDYVTEGEDTERARFRFGQGLECLEQEDWVCAEQHFRATLELRDAPPVRFNLALALYELGRYREADVLVREVLDDSETNATVREQARGLRSELRSNAGQVEVLLRGGDRSVPLEVRVDRHVVAEDELLAVLVSPGHHDIVVTQREHETGRGSVDAESGEHYTVEIELSDVPGVTAPVREGVPLEEDWRFWAGIGGGVLLTVIVIAIAAAASSPGTQAPVEGDFMPTVLRWD